MGAVLSIDYGTKRVGLAVSDATRAYVFPRDTMLRSTPTEEAAYLRALCREDGIELLAVGLPLNADGTEVIWTSKRGASDTSQLWSASFQGDLDSPSAAPGLFVLAFKQENAVMPSRRRTTQKHTSAWITVGNGKAQSVGVKIFGQRKIRDKENNVPDFNRFRALIKRAALIFPRIGLMPTV